MLRVNVGLGKGIKGRQSLAFIPEKRDLGALINGFVKDQFQIWIVAMDVRYYALNRRYRASVVRLNHLRIFNICRGNPAFQITAQLRLYARENRYFFAVSIVEDDVVVLIKLEKPQPKDEDKKCNHTPRFTSF